MQKYIKDKEIVAVFYLIFNIFLLAIAVGINSAILPTKLISAGYSSIYIAFSALIETVAAIFIMNFLSKIVAKFSAFWTIFSFSLVLFCNILAIKFVENYVIWLIFIALNGMAFMSIAIIRNAWINAMVQDKNRSIIVALSSTVFCVGFAIGPFLVKFIGANNYSSFVFSSSLTLASLLILSFAKFSQPKKIDSNKIKIKEFVKNTPHAAFARFLNEAMIASIIFLAIIFGAKLNYSFENSALFISCFMVSGFFDVYAGLLLRKNKIEKIMRLGFFLSLFVSFLAFIFREYYYVLLVAFFCFGASIALSFIAALTEVNSSYKKERLTAANATLQIIASSGAIFGCLFSGILMEFFSFYGFFLALAFYSVAYLVFDLIFRRNKKLFLRSVDKLM
jgi:MFS family permease